MSIKSKFGLFDSEGRHFDPDMAKATTYTHVPTLVQCIDLPFDGELRGAWGVRRFNKGDVYCVNDGGCRFITTKQYVEHAYKPRLEVIPSTEERMAYDWAIDQDFQSVAARYARVLAKYLQRMRIGELL